MVFYDICKIDVDLKGMKGHRNIQMGNKFPN